MAEPYFPEGYGILFTGEAAEAVAAATQESQGLESLSPDEVQALMQLQQDQNALLAYSQLTLDLGLSPSSPVSDVAAALHERDITLDEATDWLPACNYDLDCFRQTSAVELREGEERARAARVARWSLFGALSVAGVAVWWWWKKRR